MTESRTGDAGWFRRFHPAEPDAPRLLCFPHAGGSANGYHRLSQSLSPRVQVIAVQYPGRQDRRREPALTDLAELAGLIRAEVTALGAPPAFFGHSMGAMVAFEVARGLDAPPPVLFASGRSAPSRSRPQCTHPMADEAILADVERLGGTNARLLGSRAFARMMLPVLRADYQAIDTYRYVPGPPLPCPIVVLASSDDPMTPIDDALAWRAHGAAGGDSHVFTGGHFFLDASTDRITRIIRDRLP
ncbi:thioesterase II family protein [Actinomadura mexicana]|uniref:Surfactin synthase thioesterase subunit n=1 Tax=Actinomadura mexicana TaxID=134959 RepID=A0A239EEV0_9ACTN|nr:alpha/beta fold hydrolase [Actinomadura mexicana]SNS43185.1 Surfactin synthase thioesterase subunit [Actinomadura mexicana]